MRTRLLVFLCVAAVAFCAMPAFAQGSASIRVFGKVFDEGNEGLPGVTIVFESDNLIGVRSTLSGKNGEYTSPPLPAGEYKITFRMDGFQSIQQNVRLSAGQEREVDAKLRKTFEETLVVTGEATQVVSEGTTSAHTITYDTLEELPVARTFQSAVLLAPGAKNTGPGNGGGRGSGTNSITISGAQSWDNLLTMDGVVLNENIRGQAFDLYIEDAIQETTTMNSGVSAEYGRFTGGVVTAVSRSGGNEFSGSFRVSLDNEDWAARNELSAPRIDSQNETFEATVGGRIVRDRLWFFFAGRNRETENTAQTAFGNPFVQPREQDRLQGKLTAALTSSHQVQVTALEIDDLQGSAAHGGLTGFALLTNDGTLADRETPQELLSAQYTGILSTNWFVEAQYTERGFTFEGSGGLDQNLDTGTPVFDLAEGVVYNESLFCGSCEDEERDNEQARLKASYFLNTDSAGSHDLTFGGEVFTDIRNANNHQSPTDLMIWQFVPSATSTGNLADVTDISQVFPQVEAGVANMVWLPIVNPSQGTDFETTSFFVNDRWRLNDNWSFNIGLRYDENDSVNSLGLQVASDDAISPRLAVEYEVGPDSPWSFHASFAKYVGLAGNSVFDDSSSAGNPAEVDFSYFGTPILDQPAPNVMQPWINAINNACPQLGGGEWWFDPSLIFTVQSDCLTATHPDGSLLVDVFDIPGATTQIDTGLTAANTDEIQIGFNYLIGQRGTLRVDFVSREFGDFFFTQRDLTTQVATDPFDRGLIRNDNSLLRRDYDGLHTQFNLGLLEDRRLRVGGNLTWSHLRGNFNGETSGSGPISASLGEWPEYVEQRWNAPEGDLAADQRIALRAWASYDVIRTANHTLNVTWFENFASGTPYSAIATVNTGDNVTNPGYNNPDTTRDYFFSPRGAFLTDDIHFSNLAINYAYVFRGWEFFVQPEVVNVFKEDAAVIENATVSLDSNFDPFTTTPVQGTDFSFGPNFGNPVSENDIQAPREFRISLGFRANF